MVGRQAGRRERAGGAFLFTEECGGGFIPVHDNPRGVDFETGLRPRLSGCRGGDRGSGGENLCVIILFSPQLDSCFVVAVFSVSEALFEAYGADGLEIRFNGFSKERKLEVEHVCFRLSSLSTPCQGREEESWFWGRTVCSAELVIQAAGWHRPAGNLSWVAMKEGVLTVGLANVNDRVVLVVAIIRDQFGFFYVCCKNKSVSPVFPAPVQARGGGRALLTNPLVNAFLQSLHKCQDSKRLVRHSFEDPDATAVPAPASISGIRSHQLPSVGFAMISFGFE